MLKEVKSLIENTQPSILVAGSLSVVGILAGTYFLLNSKTTSSTKFKSTRFLKELELLLGEEKGLIYVSSVSTITLYDGDITAEGYLKNRVKLILQQNPWLTAELVYHQNGHLIARYDSTFDEATLSDYYQEITIDKSSSSSLQRLNDPSLPWETINTVLQPFTVKAGNACINKPNEPLFKVTVFKIMDDTQNKKDVKKSILLFSLSHVLGDGQTFYKLYSFLDHQTSVEALIAERFLDFPERIDEIYGKNLQVYLQSLPFLLSMIRNTFFSKKPTIHLFTIDLKEVVALKTEFLLPSHSSSVTHEKIHFLSTNDILTWWYFQLTHCSFGIMAINWRNRLTNYSFSHAGNYEGMIFYSQKDCETPQDIRSSLIFNHFRSNSNSLPTFWQTLQYHFSCVTNWSTFYKHLSFPVNMSMKEGREIHQTKHYPLYDMSNVVFKDLAIIFQVNEKETGLLSMSRSAEANKTLSEEIVKMMKSSTASSFSSFLRPFH
jgi:hypothetical protein